MSTFIPNLKLAASSCMINPHFLTIPKEIHDAAHLIENYAAIHGWEDWEFSGIEKRGLFQKRIDTLTRSNNSLKKLLRDTAKTCTNLLKQLETLK